MGGNSTVLYSVSERWEEIQLYCTVYLKDGGKEYNCTVQIVLLSASERWEDIQLYCIVHSVSVRWRECSCIVMYSVSKGWERIGGKYLYCTTCICRWEEIQLYCTVYQKDCKERNCTVQVYSAQCTSLI